MDEAIASKISIHTLARRVTYTLLALIPQGKKRPKVRTSFLAYSKTCQNTTKNPAALTGQEVRTSRGFHVSLGFALMYRLHSQAHRSTSPFIKTTPAPFPAHASLPIQANTACYPDHHRTRPAVHSSRSPDDMAQ